MNTVYTWHEVSDLIIRVVALKLVGIDWFKFRSHFKR